MAFGSIIPSSQPFSSENFINNLISLKKEGLSENKEDIDNFLSSFFRPPFPTSGLTTPGKVDSLEERLAAENLEKRRQGVITTPRNQGDLSPSVLGFLKNSDRSPLTPEQKAAAFADKIKKRQDLEGDSSISILASLLAGSEKDFFTRDVEIPEEIEDEGETLGSQTILAG